MDDALFDDGPLLECEWDAAKLQLCDGRPAAAWTSDETLRVLGWLVYDGTSQTSQPLHVRRCPACQRSGKGEPTALPRLAAARQLRLPFGPAAGQPPA